jgi:hypothetical protein
MLACLLCLSSISVAGTTPGTLIQLESRVFGRLTKYRKPRLRSDYFRPKHLEIYPFTPDVSAFLYYQGVLMQTIPAGWTDTENGLVVPAGTHSSNREFEAFQRAVMTNLPELYKAVITCGSQDILAKSLAREPQTRTTDLTQVVTMLAGIKEAGTVGSMNPEILRNMVDKCPPVTAIVNNRCNPTDAPPTVYRDIYVSETDPAKTAGGWHTIYMTLSMPIYATAWSFYMIPVTQAGKFKNFECIQV